MYGRRTTWRRPCQRTGASGDRHDFGDPGITPAITPGITLAIRVPCQTLTLADSQGAWTGEELTRARAPTLTARESVRIQREAIAEVISAVEWEWQTSIGSKNGRISRTSSSRHSPSPNLGRRSQRVLNRARALPEWSRFVRHAARVCKIRMCSFERGFVSGATTFGFIPFAIGQSRT